MASWAPRASDELKWQMMGFDVNGTVNGTVQWQPNGDSEEDGDEDTSTTGTVVDPAAMLARNVL